MNKIKRNLASLTAIATLVLLLVAISGVSSAATSEQNGGIHVGDCKSDSPLVVVKNENYKDGFNVDRPVYLGPSYAATWFGIEYTPTKSYKLKKVELIAGQGTGEFIIQLRTDNMGMPDTTILRETSFNMVDTISWQGAEFSASYHLTAGNTYWIVFKPVPNSQASIAYSGAPITHVYDFEGDGWDDKVDSFPWMVKFYKDTTIIEDTACIW